MEKDVDIVPSDAGDSFWTPSATRWCSSVVHENSGSVSKERHPVLRQDVCSIAVAEGSDIFDVQTVEPGVPLLHRVELVTRKVHTIVCKTCGTISTSLIFVRTESCSSAATAVNQPCGVSNMGRFASVCQEPHLRLPSDDVHGGCPYRIVTVHHNQFKRTNGLSRPFRDGILVTVLTGSIRCREAASRRGRPCR